MMSSSRHQSLRLIVAFATALTAATGVGAQPACDRPWPVEVPDVIPSKAELLVLQKQVKQFLKAAETYLQCNDELQRKLPPDAPTTDQTIRILASQYNNTVDEMHVVGEQFNALVRKFKNQDG